VDAIGFSERYREVWPKLIGIEMEAGGVASALYQTADAPNVFMIRGVSDLADPDKEKARVREWRPYACDVAASYTVAFLKSGPVPPQSSAGADSETTSSSDAVEAEHLRSQIDALRNRLRYLELRAATMGWDAPTFLKQEIDEIKKSIGELSARLGAQGDSSGTQ
jgi:hypothetical protein